MEFRVRKASGGEYEERREINTVEDLKKLAEEHPTKAGDPECLIVAFNGWCRSEPTIVVYDDYIE